MIDIFKTNEAWQDVKDAAMNTIGLTKGKYPDSEWKRRIVLSEHSPIRCFEFTWRWKGIKSWVSVHFVRHWLGIVHWVSTQRNDRTKEDIDRNKSSQDTPVNHRAKANIQAMINISRKRLCNCASPETRLAWQEVKDKVAEIEPEVAKCMVRDCVYRGWCYEYESCGFHKTEAFKKELDEYRRNVNGYNPED